MKNMLEMAQEHRELTRCTGEHVWGKTRTRDGRRCEICHLSDAQLERERIAADFKFKTEALRKGWKEYHKQQGTAKEK